MSGAVPETVGVRERPRVGIGDALASAAGASAHWRAWLRVALVLQVVVAVVAGPLMALLLRGALRAAGVSALTEASLGQVVRHPLAVALLLLLALTATTAVLLQHAGFLLLGRELRAGRVPGTLDLARQGLAAARRLFGPELGLVALYVLVLAPLGGFSLAAAITRGIEVPPFIAGELNKTPLGTAAWLVAVAAVLLLNVRLVLVPALLLTTTAPPTRAFATSWRLTRRRGLGIALLALAAWAVAAVLAMGLLGAAVSLVRVSDALWPAGSPVVAGVVLSLAQAGLLVAAGLLTGFLSAVLLALASPGDGSAPPVPERREGGRAAVLGVVLVLLMVPNTVALLAVAEGRPTAIVAHRGDTFGDVENTVESLESAAAMGADHVELDVQQAADGGLVVVHDVNLRRIAGVSRNVFDMTTAELTATTVRQGGLTGTIPSFDAFAARAAELGVSLLVELKEHGREQGDMPGDVVAVLAEHGLVETALVQAFDTDTVAELESRFPEVTTGQIVAFSRGRLDPGAADFVTLEQNSWSRAVMRQADAAGVQVFLWTVSDPLRMRAFMRAGVDGLITDRPAGALEERTAVAAETGLADRVGDALRALVDW